VQIAEPNALICFAGPRVIEQTIREKLPEGFQRAEYLLDHGMLDRVTKRTELREELITITRMLLGLPPAVRGDLPAPEAQPKLEAPETGESPAPQEQAALPGAGSEEAPSADTAKPKATSQK
jgi:acetyl-CoA carboxylase carboxyl transferase subunit beta